MSAWTVSKAHIDAMIGAALSSPVQTFSWYQGDERTVLDERNVDEIGQMLWDENYLSVNYRYEDNKAAPQYEYAAMEDKPAVALLKAIDCYEYQSCEHPGWDDSSAKAFCDALSDMLIGRLPGYDAAPWGFEEADRGTPPILLSSLTSSTR
jgi:hypothetical protein